MSDAETAAATKLALSGGGRPGTRRFFGRGSPSRSSRAAFFNAEAKARGPAQASVWGVPQQARHADSGSGGVSRQNSREAKEEAKRQRAASAGRRLSRSDSRRIDQQVAKDDALHAALHSKRKQSHGASSPEKRRPSLFHKNVVFPMEVTGRETISLLSRNSTTNLWHRKDIHEEVTFNEVVQAGRGHRAKLLEEERAREGEAPPQEQLENIHKIVPHIEERCTSC